MSESSYVASMTPSQRRRYERQAAITPFIKATVARAGGYVCTYCGRAGDCWADPDDAKWNVDHIKPVALGGTHDLENLTLACARCNRIKGATPLDDLLAHLELMLAGPRGHKVGN